jgi:hypothetical protein
MLIEQFNKNIVQVSHRLALLRLSRNQLAAEEQAIFREMMKVDQEEKGYFWYQEIMDLWLEKSKAEENDKLSFLKQVFPFDEVSYSM